MKKVMLSAAMLAMVLAAAAPALGQIGGNQGPVAGDDAVQAGDNVQYAAVCQNIIGAFNGQGGQDASPGPIVTVEPSPTPTASPPVTGDLGPIEGTAASTATAQAAVANQGGFAGSFAVGGENAATVAEIAQEQNVSVEQVNECLNASAAAATAGSAAETAAQAGGGGGATATATTTATASASATATALPSTGGPVPSSTLALGAGALLVVSGLLARRIAR